MVVMPESVSVLFEPQDVFCSLDLASQCAPRPGVTAPRHALNGDLLQPRLAAMGGVDRRLRDAKPVRYKRFECLVGTAGLGQRAHTRASTGPRPHGPRLRRSRRRKISA